MQRKEWDDFTGYDKRGWICDHCRQPIEKAKDGWLQWINPGGGGPARDLSLVHHLPASPLKDSVTHGCQFDGKLEFEKDRGIIGDLGLSAFLGHDGLMSLLALLSDGEFPLKNGIEIIQRLHIPGYEHARAHFKSAIAEGVIEPNQPPGFYWQGEIEAVLRWASEQRVEY